MGYCTISDVQALNPTRRYGAQTTPSTEEVLFLIDLRAAELDAMLADTGISTPVPATSTVSYAWLRAANAYGAAMDAEAAMHPGQLNRDETLGHVEYLRKRWDAMTKALTDGRVNLTDAPRLPATSTSSGPLGIKRAVSTGGAATSWFRHDQVDQLGGW